MQPHHAFDTRPATTTSRPRVLLALLMFPLVLLAPLAAADDDDDLGVFAPLGSIPAEVDAAAVFDNPAESILLSPVGRSMRALLASVGIFTQTERAWQSLADAFDAPVDDTILGLLSKRVIVVWDGFELADPSVQGLTDSIDSRWALACEVQPAYLDTIRNAMRPVKRDIVHGRAVYAIEQGRYRIALLDAPRPGEPAIILLSPRSGAELLHAVLASIVGRDAKDAPLPAITAGHEPMLRELNTHHALDSDAHYAFAMIARTPIFRALINQPVEPDQRADHTLAAIVTLDRGTLSCHFASDLPVPDTLPDAPVELYEASSPDAIFALASARAPGLMIRQSGMHLGLSATDLTRDQDTPGLFDAPALLVMQPSGPGGDYALSSVLVQTHRDPGQTARLADEAMQSMIAGYDPDQAPDFGGRLPDAIRSVALHPRDRGSPTSGSSWLGSAPRLAWISTTGSDSDLFIASITPATTDPAVTLRLLQDAARSLNALGDRPRSGVLLRAMIRPGHMLKALSDPSLTDLALAKLVRRLELDIRRGVDASLRGELKIRFANDPNGANLGSE